ncbi:hypothetical protein JVU11DRAFT_7963 [Chiua virens]|nr:hypothetical protein JVU11DRAFT_7963 [Chiua virens]
MPIQICLWSIVSLTQFWLSDKRTFFLCPALLGLVQGGFHVLSVLQVLVAVLMYTDCLPDFYTRTELPIRLAGLWMSMNLCNIISGFLAYGILHLDGLAGKAGWRWLFLIEGLITSTIGVACFFNMPPSPTQTKTWFRLKGWFTEREEVIIVNKILRDDPTKGDMHNREGLTLKCLWNAICNYDLWPVYILGLMTGILTGIPSSPPTNYLTLLLRHAGKVQYIQHKFIDYTLSSDRDPHYIPLCACVRASL